MIAAYRKFTAADSYVRAGWSGPLSLAPMQPLDELTLGLVGCGTIATQAAPMCEPLVGRILTFDPFAAEIPAFVERVDKLDDLLIQSQLLILHLPLSAQTLRHHDSLLQQLAGHDHPLDLVGALVHLRDSRAAGSFRS